MGELSCTCRPCGASGDGSGRIRRAFISFAAPPTERRSPWLLTRGNRLVYVVQSLTAGRAIVSTLESRLGWRKRAAGETFHLKFAFQHLAQFFNYRPDASDPRQPKRHLCIRVFFPSMRMRREAAQLEIPGQTPLETHMKPDAQFHEETGVRPCGWFTISATTPPVRLVSGVDRWSCDDLECGANVTHIRPLDNSHRLCATIPDLAIMSFDIEVVSSCFNADGSRKFPRAAEIAASNALQVLGLRKTSRYRS